MFIYRTKCLPSGKYYIGMTSKDESESYLGSGKAFKRAIKKYGLKDEHGNDNFVREILEHHETREDLIEAEIRLIAKHDAVASGDYYNMAPGGDGCGAGEDHPNYGRTGAKHPQSLKWSVTVNGKTETFDCKREVEERYNMNSRIVGWLRNKCIRDGPEQYGEFKGMLITSTEKSTK